MAKVVFLRGVNVGGHKRFRSRDVVDALADLDVDAIGAAGTFIVRAPVDAVSLRGRIVAHLGFDTSVLIMSSDVVLGAHARAPFGNDGGLPDVKRYLSILDAPPRTRPDLPVDRPAEGDWQVRITAVKDRFAFSVRRPTAAGRFYPNEVVERVLGVGATTRDWNTVDRIAAKL